MINTVSKEYSQILYVINTMVDYYAKLFNILPVSNITKLKVSPSENYLTFRFDSVNNSSYTTEDMKSILNEYLRYLALPEDKVLKKYKAGTGLYEVVESLYVASVQIENGTATITVLYINDPVSYGIYTNISRKGITL